MSRDGTLRVRVDDLWTKNALVRGQAIATGGEGYNTRANALEGPKAVQRDAPTAEIVEG